MFLIRSTLGNSCKLFNPAAVMIVKNIHVELEEMRKSQTSIKIILKPVYLLGKLTLGAFFHNCETTFCRDLLKMCCIQSITAHKPLECSF